MNPIAKLLIDMSRFYNHAISEQTLEMYVDVLSQWPPEQVLAAGREYVRNPKNTRFPIPPHTIMPQTHQADAKDLARDTAMRIQYAVTKFGWNNSRAAKEYIGETGWRVVERFGGWEYLCQNLGLDLQVGTFIAQCRDAIESSVNLTRLGFDQSRPPIEQSPQPIEIGSMVKQLAEKRKME